MKLRNTFLHFLEYYQANRLIHSICARYPHRTFDPQSVIWLILRPWCHLRQIFRGFAVPAWPTKRRWPCEELSNKAYGASGFRVNMNFPAASVSADILCAQP